MYVLDLFSGIGGFSLGLERAGMQTVAFCEIDPFCRAVLAKHWPDVPIFGDIGELEGGQFSGTIDVVCGGFPCQPFSVAGKRRGKDDDRALWPEMLRIIREVQPAWVIGENVSGIIPMELDGCLSDLEASGYACQTFVVPACAVDAKHRRDRVWIVAHAHGGGQRMSNPRPGRGSQSPESRHNVTRSGQNVADTGRQSERPPVARFSGKPVDGQTTAQRANKGNRPPNRDNDVADSGSAGLQGNVREGPSRTERLSEGHATERGGWLAEPDVGRVAHGISHRVDRLRSLGNAVVPQVVEAIGRILMESDE